MDSKKALIAMSGGVDSSAAAYLTQQAGYICMGATMKLFDNTILHTGESTCCSLDDVEDARSVARRLNIPFHVFNGKDAFSRCVIDPFIHSYENGETPNPCILCNRHLKFDFFLERAKLLGCDYIVTGHYARIRFDESANRWQLLKAADYSKDQSYVLYCLSQQQLAHTLLPLGELSKEQARSIAEAQGFVNARKRDSQDICFVPDGDYVAFMEHYTGKQYSPGDFLDLSGKTVGKHRGAVAYTLGQRKGLGLAMGQPVYVCGKDMKNNTVTVGPNASLFASTVLARDFNWVSISGISEPMAVTARARYNQKEQPATVYPGQNGLIRVVFDQPQRAMTPGQAVVLYLGELVIGGGTIAEVIA